MADKKLYTVTATNHATGETWSISDSHDTCERELNAKLADWTTVNGKAVGQPIHVTTSGPTPVDG